MAKRNKQKRSVIAHHQELTGLLLGLFVIIGIFEYGPVGNAISSLALLLVGSYYKYLLLWLAFMATMMVLNHKAPKLLSIRMIGFFALFLSLLVLAHLKLIDGHTWIAVLKTTIDNFVIAFKTNHDSIVAGGGFIGASIALAFARLFTTGASTIAIVIGVVGGILMLNMSIIDITKKIYRGFKNVLAFINAGKPDKEEKAALKAEKKANKEHKNNKVVISSIDEITQNHEEIKEEVEDDNHLSAKMDQSNRAYKLPPISLLDIPKKQANTNQTAVQANIEILEKVFRDFEIEGKVVEVHVGPSVTQYEVELAAGTKVNRVLSINREIALALAAKVVRIQAPIPGKNTIGVEIPNMVNTVVALRDVIMNMPSIYENSKLAVGLGKDIMGKSSYAEINKTPHLLVAGATGSGKSVCINTIIVSLLIRCRPDEVKLVLIDPKKVELSVYNGIPHLLSPVVTDPKKAAIALMKIVSEMESRYDLFNETATKSIAGYNQYIEEKNKHLSDGEKIKKMPFIVVIIDELADLMLVAAKEVEDSIMRITQMARAAGIHLIVATQRPSTDIITGIIKANIPSRISFAASSNVDSRTILDQGGAEKLLGKGDMLFLPMGENLPIRLQGCFISDDEVKRVVDYTVKQQKAQYDEHMMISDEKITSKNEHNEDEDDPLYKEIVEFAVKTGKISASLIQRKYRFGYNRAARVVDLLESRGIVGPANGSKPREVLVRLEKEQEDEDE